MNLSYTDEQLLLRDSAARFLADCYDLTQRQRIVASVEGYSPEIWQQFGELGWLALTLPEFAGGLEGGPVELSLLMETFGKALVVEPFVPSIVLGARAVLASGDGLRRRALLNAVGEGTARLAFAHTERKSSYRLSSVSTTACRRPNGWRLEGRKSLVLGGAAADWLIVSARLFGELNDADGIGLFLVPRTAAGLDVTSFALTDGSRAAEVTLTTVDVPADALLGDCESALPVIEEVIDRAIAALAADAVGAMNVLLDATVAYSKERVQFGQPIGKFQAIQHRLAELTVEAEEARALALLATLRADASPAVRGRAASAAKVKVGRAARHIAEQAVQLHGAMGVTEELQIGAYFKRVLVFDLLFGSVAHHLERYAGLGDAAAVGRGVLDTSDRMATPQESARQAAGATVTA
jgi:alkylation response protein AidB-like acyl-CoA dehydrogenase